MRGLIFLDRDGVLNEIVVDPEHGTIDSPLHPDQVRVFPWVPGALARISKLGFDLAIISNQPAAAKGKTTLANLQATHERVVALAESGGARIGSSHLCFHRSEDGCGCRKPKTGLLEEAFKRGFFVREGSWIVGDGVTDVQAGKDFGVQTAFLGPKKCDACKILDSDRPDFWGENLEEFAGWLANKESGNNVGRR